MKVRRLWLIASFAAMLATRLAAGESPDVVKAGADAGAARRLLAEMRKRAERTKIYKLAAGDETPVELFAEPLMRYSDQPRVIADATMWAFGAPGRPEAILKVEAYRRADGELVWLYSMGSLAEGLIRAEWGDGHRWKSKQPGLSWQPLTPAAPAKETPELRTRQLKALSRRFAVLADDPGRGKEELRLLTQPIYRYADPEADIDAAIFGFASYGTNPNALVAVELLGNGTESAWRFALARMTDAGLDARLDGKQVWTTPASAVGPVELDSWLYFWEAADGPGD
jgi:hypothetical protein